MKIPTTEQAEEEIADREFLLPPSLRELRQKLGQKAKHQKRYRFYSLYGLVCRSDVLQAAWAAVRRHNGAPGVEGVSIEQIAATPEREAAFLDEIQTSLRNRTYRAQAVRRVSILKANGKLRPLGIPTVRDRVVQGAVWLILEPIFEADFEECSHGFRPGRSAHGALRTILRHLKEGQTAVYDADLAGYFDSLPHDKLLACVRMRVVDGSVLGLIRPWLNAPVVERSMGYTFRYDRDQYGRAGRDWNLVPSRKAMDREREALRELINPHQSHTPLPELIGRWNRHLRGWAKYFGLGYPRRAFRHLNHFVRYRLGKHLHRRSQRGWRVRDGVSLYAHLDHLGLVAL